MTGNKTASVLLLILVLLLCACGSSTEPAPETALPQESQTPQERPAGMESILPGSDQADTARTKVTPEPVSEHTEEVEDEAYLTAVSLIGLDVSELYDAVGEPVSSDYSSSCLGSGMDGELKYEAFTVYTYLEDESEIIQDVIK